MEDRNPFLFGAVVSGGHFTDRVEEIETLRSALRSGQDCAIIAPRRLGKSSLIRRVAGELRDGGVLVVGPCDLFFTPSKQVLARRLAETIYADLAGLGDRLERMLHALARLRVRPTMTFDPDGHPTFSFAASVQPEDADRAVEALLELVGHLAEERDAPVVLILDEFQQVLELDRDYPKLFRAVFQQQPRVAHVYLGSHRHLMRRLFADENEPFFRSARLLELGAIPLNWFASFIRRRFGDSGREASDAAIERILAITGGHPYQTQELSSYAWTHTRPAGIASGETVDAALVDAVDNGNAYYTRIWSDLGRIPRLVLLALAREDGRLYAEEYRHRHALPSSSAVQTAVARLAAQELVASPARGVTPRIVDPFFRAWLRRAEELPLLAPIPDERLAEVRAAMRRPLRG